MHDTSSTRHGTPYGMSYYMTARIAQQSRGQECGTVCMHGTAWPRAASEWLAVTYLRRVRSAAQCPFRCHCDLEVRAAYPLSLPACVCLLQCCSLLPSVCCSLCASTASPIPTAALSLPNRLESGRPGITSRNRSGSSESSRGHNRRLSNRQKETEQTDETERWMSCVGVERGKETERERERERERGQWWQAQLGERLDGDGRLFLTAPARPLCHECGIVGLYVVGRCNGRRVVRPRPHCALTVSAVLASRWWLLSLHGRFCLAPRHSHSDGRAVVSSAE